MSKVLTDPSSAERGMYIGHATQIFDEDDEQVCNAPVMHVTLMYVLLDPEYKTTMIKSSPGYEPSSHDHIPYYQILTRVINQRELNLREA